MGEGQRRGGGSTWGCVIEGGCSDAPPANVMSGATPGGQGGLLDLTVGLGRLRCGSASTASNFDGGGGRKLLVRTSGRCLYRGRCSCGWGAMTRSRCQAGFGDNP
jgi:hypothetical protein